MDIRKSFDLQKTKTPLAQKGEKTVTSSKAPLGVLNWFSIILLLLGIGIVLMFGANPSGKATVFIWMLACLLAGTFIGFLFGIPKIVQTTPTSQAKIQSTVGTTTETPPDINSTSPGTGYQQQVNSNLTEISDWLTKIIVGLGLVNLNKVPPYLSKVANILAVGLNQKETQPAGLSIAFAYGTIISYTCLGFLFGYITTRIYLASAFSEADQNALKKIVETTNETASKAQSALNKAEFALVNPATPIQRDEETPLHSLKELAIAYINTRKTLPSGNFRTSKMTEIIKGMMTLVPELTNFDVELQLGSSDIGEQLTAYAYLYVKPDPKYVNILADAIIKDTTPFGQYWGIQALGKVLALMPGQLAPDTFTKLKAFHDQLDRGIDREYELRKVLQLP